MVLEDSLQLARREPIIMLRLGLSTGIKVVVPRELLASGRSIGLPAFITRQVPPLCSGGVGGSRFFRFYRRVSIPPSELLQDVLYITSAKMMTSRPPEHPMKEGVF